MRLRSVLFGLAVVCGSVALTGSASTAGGARATTCHGQEATIVGHARLKVLRGTPGDDIIVTNGAESTRGRGGDDLICSNGTLGTIQEYGTFIDAGPGNDTVDASRSGRSADAFVDLGPGDDVYLGGDRITDVVTAVNEETGDPEGSDTISTGDGVDSVETGSDDPLAPDTDTVDLGPGADDLVLVGTTDPSQPLQGGSGSDRILVDARLMAAPTIIDNSTGTLTTITGPMAAWASFERFELDREGDGAYVPPRFIGNDGHEYVDSRVTLDDVDLGGGDDRLELWPEEAPDTQDVTLEGGAGTDKLFYHEYIDNQSLIYDLGTGSMTFGRNPSTLAYAHASGFEKNDLSVQWLQVTGSAGPDVVTWEACTGSVSGWKGDDRLTWSSFSRYSGPEHCRDHGQPAGISVHGNGGDDELLGGRLNDILIGGAGDDTADGARGEDKCRAETRVSCERH